MGLDWHMRGHQSNPQYIYIKGGSLTSLLNTSTEWRKKCFPETVTAFAVPKVLILSSLDPLTGLALPPRISDLSV